MKKSYECNNNIPSKFVKKLKSTIHLNYLDVYLCSTQDSVEQ